MSDPTDRLARDAPGVTSAERVRAGDVVDVYRGRLGDGDGAVRILAVSPAADDRVADAFDRAADDWTDAHTHPNVVRVYARGDSPRPWIAVADAPGETLAAVQSRLSPGERRTVAVDVTEALRIARLYNATHLALTPDDVRIVVRDGTVHALVDGWGIERACRVAAGESPSSPYTAPELLDDPTGGDERTVVYGIGAVTYFALTGHLPVDGPAEAGDIHPASERSLAVPPAVDDVLSTALSRRPADRYESVSAFGTAIERALPPASVDDGASTGGYAARAATEAANGRDTATTPDPDDGVVPDETRPLVADVGYGVGVIVALLVGYVTVASLLFSPLGVAALPGAAEVPWNHDVVITAADDGSTVEVSGETPANKLYVQYLDNTGGVVQSTAVVVENGAVAYNITSVPADAVAARVQYNGMLLSFTVAPGFIDAKQIASLSPTPARNSTATTSKPTPTVSATPAGNTTASQPGR